MPSMQKSGHTFDDCPIFNNISHLKKHYISWKMFLARAARQQDKMAYYNQINQLETGYFYTQQEQYYSMNEEVNFLQQDNKDVHFPQQAPQHSEATRHHTNLSLLQPTIRRLPHSSTIFQMAAEVLHPLQEIS